MGSIAGGTGRARAVMAALAVAFFGLVLRLYALQVSGHEESAKRRDDQSRGRLDLRRPRGLILDAQSQTLAVSIPVSSVFAEPRRLTDPAGSARRLAAALGRPTDEIAAALSRTVRSADGSTRPAEFAWIRRHVTDAQARAVRELAIPGIGLKTEFDRIYPNGSALCHVLGLCNLDDAGGEGVERACDAWLTGTAHGAGVDVDGRRRPLDYPELPPAGADVRLTIDLRLQRVLEEELDALVARTHPRWVSAVAIDPRTGAVLAMANRPSFDPNEPVPAGADPIEAARARQNLALIAPYEPGSTWKPFAILGALDAGLATPSTPVDCEMGAWRVGSRVLHDHHPYGRLTLTEVIAKSSNIGAAKLGGVMLGAPRLWKVADAFGFGRRTGIDLPAEAPGTLHPLARWTSFSVTSIPMGHEIAVTPLQLVTAMAAIAADGEVRRPYVVERISTSDGRLLRAAQPRVERTVGSPESCAAMRKILRETVKAGTGTKADVPGLEVCGKTGTTQKVDPATGRYGHERYISSFVGFAPQENARICLAVVVDEPHGEYYGGTVAAPVVAEVLRRGMPFVK